MDQRPKDNSENVVTKPPSRIEQVAPICGSQNVSKPPSSSVNVIATTSGKFIADKLS